jgi:hypothetical protein
MAIWRTKGSPRLKTIKSICDGASVNKAARRGRRRTIGYELVIVEWEDSARPISGWQWIDEYQMPETVPCMSVGFLIAVTESAIALAPNLGDVGRDRAQASGIIRIPRSSVRSLIQCRLFLLGFSRLDMRHNGASKFANLSRCESAWRFQAAACNMLDLGSSNRRRGASRCLSHWNLLFG